ncbi:uroplakin-2 [Lepisosteus oculatus]|nr:PREDICTED: uroplakin-2 [Lepisosteus oculatus]
MGALLLAALGLLLAAADADFTVNVLGESDGLVTGQLSDSVILSLPPCSLAGNTVNMVYQQGGTQNKVNLTGIFKVPVCRFKRDLITVIANSGQFTVTRNIGYQVKNLSPATNYTFQYFVGSEKSNAVQAATRTVSNYQDIDDGLPARSGAMVVITVLLSVAMFILIVGLIVTLVLAHCRN